MVGFFILWTTLFCLLLYLLYLPSPWVVLELFLNTIFLVEEWPSSTVSRLLGWLCILLKWPSEYHLNSFSTMLLEPNLFEPSQIMAILIYEHLICYVKMNFYLKLVWFCFSSFENGLFSSLVSFPIREFWPFVIELHESY